jgi:monomeric isocitrate dehydrogenase
VVFLGPSYYRDKKVVRCLCAVNRARATNVPTIFWLDENRAHDRKVIEKVTKYLKITIQLEDIRILNPIEATNFTLERTKDIHLCHWKRIA